MPRAKALLDTRPTPIKVPKIVQNAIPTTDTRKVLSKPTQKARQ